MDKKPLGGHKVPPGLDRVNGIRQGERKVPAPISTIENFHNMKVIPTKCGHFY